MGETQGVCATYVSYSFQAFITRDTTTADMMLLGQTAETQCSHFTAVFTALLFPALLTYVSSYSRD